MLVLYSGQSRLIRQCWPWHEHSYKEVQKLFPDVTIDLQYALWDKAWDVQLNTDDILSAIFNLTKEFKITANVFSQDSVMQQSFDMYDSWAKSNFKEPYNHVGNLADFTKGYSQLKSRELAVNKIKEDYDVVFLTRSDIIFNSETVIKLVNQFVNKNKALYRDSYKAKSHFIYCEYVEYRDYMGVASSDQVFVGSPDALRIWVKDFDKKLQKFLFRNKEQWPSLKFPIDPHSVAIAWTYDYGINPDESETVVFTGDPDLSNLSAILRPQLIDTFEVKNPSAENLAKLNLMGKPYVGRPVDTANISTRVY